MSKEFNLFKYHWYCELEGGRLMHPKFPNSYYDESAITAYTNNLVELYIKKNPTTIDYWNGNTYHPIYGAGVLKSKEIFTYGVYEAHIRMPKGRNLWPSFWLTGVNSWPPEIDIVEGYTNRLSSYLKGFNWRLESNVHYSVGDTNNIEVAGAKRTSIFKLFGNPSNNSYKYTLVWTKNTIDFYLEDILIRSIHDEVILNSINKDPWVNVIFQMGVPITYNDKDAKSLKQPMVISSFRYTKLNQ